MLDGGPLLFVNRCSVCRNESLFIHCRTSRGEARVFLKPIRNRHVFLPGSCILPIVDQNSRPLCCLTVIIQVSLHFGSGAISCRTIAEMRLQHCLHPLIAHSVVASTLRVQNSSRMTFGT